MAIAAKHGDAARMLARRKTSTDCPHAVLAADQLETVHGDVVSVLEIEASLAPLAAASD